jgi:hypothetical protein
MGLEGCTQPHVRTRAEEPGQVHVILFEVHDCDIVLEGTSSFENLADQRLAAVVAGVGLPGEDHLKRPCGTGDAPQPVEVGE